MSSRDPITDNSQRRRGQSGRSADRTEWQVLRYELESFVCRGSTSGGCTVSCPASCAASTRPAAGSLGQRLLRQRQVAPGQDPEYLWRDVILPDGATSRGLVQLPAEIGDLLRELTTAGKRAGGLWSAAGKLGAGERQRALALLGRLRSAGLPELPRRPLGDLAAAEGHYDAVCGQVRRPAGPCARAQQHVRLAGWRALLAAVPNIAASPRRGQDTEGAVPNPRRHLRRRDARPNGRGAAAAVHARQAALHAPRARRAAAVHRRDAGRALPVQDVVEACSSRSAAACCSSPPASRPCRPRLSCRSCRAGSPFA